MLLKPLCAGLRKCSCTLKFYMAEVQLSWMRLFGISISEMSLVRPSWIFNKGTIITRLRSGEKVHLFASLLSFDLELYSFGSLSPLSSVLYMWLQHRWQRWEWTEEVKVHCFSAKSWDKPVVYLYVSKKPVSTVERLAAKEADITLGSRWRPNPG